MVLSLLAVNSRIFEVITCFMFCGSRVIFLGKLFSFPAFSAGNDVTVVVVVVVINIIIRIDAIGGIPVINIRVAAIIIIIVINCWLFW